MRRREFLAASAATAVGVMGAPLRAAEHEQSGRQFFELRTYQFASPPKRQAFEQFIAEAAVPALNRAGVEPVGAFKAADEGEDGKPIDPRGRLWLLLPHNSLQSVIELHDKLAGDDTFQRAGHAVLAASKSDPAYLRYQSTLLLAMSGAPRAMVPTRAPSRVFELRTYESHSTERARNKLAMFNAGEFRIFQSAGMPGVFFGGAVVGEDLPQLTYMIVHERIEDSRKNWKAFFDDPEWKKLSSDRGYKDNVSKVIDRFLRPAEGSQI